MTTRLPVRAKPALDEDPGAWRQHGLCRRYPADVVERVFLPPHRGQARAAKWACQRCPVLDSCRAWILSEDAPIVEHGVIAAMSAKERKRIRFGKTQAVAVELVARAAA
jgi:hypothetical protein